MLSLKLLTLLFITLMQSSVDGEIFMNCDENPCQHGRCTDLYRKTAYQCECDEGWEGENCDQSKFTFLLFLIKNTGFFFFEFYER